MNEQMNEYTKERKSEGKNNQTNLAKNKQMNEYARGIERTNEEQTKLGKNEQMNKYGRGDRMKEKSNKQM